MTHSILHILFSPDLLDFFLFAFSLFIFFSFGEFSREVAFSSRKSGILHFPDMIRPMFREKISLAPSASFLFSYFLFSIFLISAALTSLRSLSSEISGKIHRESKKTTLEVREHRSMRIFRETFLPDPARLIIGERIDARTEWKDSSRVIPYKLKEKKKHVSQSTTDDS